MGKVGGVLKSNHFRGKHEKQYDIVKCHDDITGSGAHNHKNIWRHRCIMIKSADTIQLIHN